MRPPRAPPAPTPARAPIIGPAAMNGPRPGMASAPMPASQPRVPPTTAPLVAPVAVPSGAFVFFSAAKSLLPWLLCISTEMSVLRKPSALSSSTARSTCARSRYNPYTAVFLPAMRCSPLLDVVLLLVAGLGVRLVLLFGFTIGVAVVVGLDRKLVGYFARA